MSSPPPRQLLHFGPNGSLYGVLHGANETNAETAALICAPLGHEYLRAHFIVQRLAQRLAAAGIPTLRFDYYGCFDSLGDARDGTCTRWQEDIVTAHRELLRRTGARRVSAMGVRLGATLLAHAAARAEFAKLVLWDPVERGSEYLAALRSAHQRVVRASPLLSLRARLRHITTRGSTELLGSSHSRAGLQELAKLAMPQRPSSAGPPLAHFRTDTAWLDLAKLEDMLPDADISRQLSQLMQPEGP